MTIRARRRAFALIAALGTLVILSLIVKGLCDSVMRGQTISRQWSHRADERLAQTWALRALDDTATDQPVAVQWGETSVEAQARPLAPDSPIYGHGALSHRPGDRLAVVRVGEETVHFLLRAGLGATGPTHHRLPTSLAAAAQETSP